MSKKEVKLQNAIERYENLMLEVMQVQAQIKMLQLKEERLREDLGIIATNEMDGDIDIPTRYDHLIEW
jgi:hypothetical protein